MTVAARYGRIDVLKLLIERSGSIEYRGAEGFQSNEYNPVMFEAAQGGHREAVSWLLESGKHANEYTGVATEGVEDVLRKVRGGERMAAAHY
jgi:hypothetical protein